MNYKTQSSGSIFQKSIWEFAPCAVAEAVGLIGPADFLDAAPISVSISGTSSLLKRLGRFEPIHPKAMPVILTTSGKIMPREQEDLSAL